MPRLNCSRTEEHKNAEENIQAQEKEITRKVRKSTEGKGENKEKDTCEESESKGPTEEQIVCNEDGKQAHTEALGKYSEDQGRADTTGKEAEVEDSEANADKGRVKATCFNLHCESFQHTQGAGKMEQKQGK